MTLGQLLLFRLPFLDTVGDVDGDALGPEVSATDVARDRHGGNCHCWQPGNQWQSCGNTGYQLATVTWQPLAVTLLGTSHASAVVCRHQSQVCLLPFIGFSEMNKNFVSSIKP